MFGYLKYFYIYKFRNRFESIKIKCIDRVILSKLYKLAMDHSFTFESHTKNKRVLVKIKVASLWEEYLSN